MVRTLHYSTIKCYAMMHWIYGSWNMRCDLVAIEDLNRWFDTLVDFSSTFEFDSTVF